MTHEGTDVAARLDALEREVAALRETVATLSNRDVPVLKGTVRAMTDDAIDSVDDFPEAGQAFNRRIDRLDERLEAVEARLADLGTVGQDRTSKEEKFAAILMFAQNKRADTAKVSLTPHEVRGCAGVSRRYAYELIEAMAADVAGVRVREPTCVQTGSGVEQKRKALLIDCEQVRTEFGGVNQFTTREGGRDGR